MLQQSCRTAQQHRASALRRKEKLPRLELGKGTEIDSEISRQGRNISWTHHEGGESTRFPRLRGFSPAVLRVAFISRRAGHRSYRCTLPPAVRFQPFYEWEHRRRLRVTAPTTAGRRGRNPLEKSSSTATPDSPIELELVEAVGKMDQPFARPGGFAMKSSILLLALLSSASLAWAQRPTQRAGWGPSSAAEQPTRTAPSPEFEAARTQLEKRVPSPIQQLLSADLARLKQDADELASLAQSIPPDVEQTTKGILPKDLGTKLKRIEKLSKQLRSRISP
jgi:hypothetical protein